MLHVLFMVGITFVFDALVVGYVIYKQKPEHKGLPNDFRDL